jgi:glucosamine 6-phosphate synthetase-like amidotransferase/phosphosugar isomerase protein
MCGIAGVMRIGPNAEPITLGQIQALLTSLQHRGADATGVAFLNGDTVLVHKAPEIAWKYLTSDGFRDFVKENLTDETRTCLLHTRAATIGDAWKNYNNHPMFNGGAAAVHNGHIGNHDELFREFKLKRTAETDSDIIRAIVDEWGISRKALQKLDKMRGTCATAVIDPKTPKKLLLMRSGSPLVMAKMGDQLVWASEKKAIHLAARRWTKQWGMLFQANRADLVFNPMTSESAWILDEEEMIAHAADPAWEPFHTEFQTTHEYRKPEYKVHESYERKQEAKRLAEANERKPEEKKGTLFLPQNIEAARTTKLTQTTVDSSAIETGEQDGRQWIPCEKCTAMCELTEAMGNVEAEDLICSDCGNPLDTAIIAPN